MLGKPLKTNLVLFAEKLISVKVISEFEVFVKVTTWFLVVLTGTLAKLIGLGVAVNEHCPTPFTN